MSTLPLQQIENLFAAKQGISLHGSPPELPLELLIANLKQELQATELTLSIKSRKIDDPLEGFGSNVHSICFHLTPLTGTGFLIVSKNDFENCAKKTVSDTPFSWGSKLLEAYESFFKANLAHAFNKTEALPGLSVQLAEQTLLPAHPMTAIDCSLTIDGSVVPVRILLSKELKAHITSHFKETKLELKELKIAQELEVPLAIELGRVSLTRSEWEEIQIGDFITLPKKEFPALLTFEQVPLFYTSLDKERVRLEEIIDALPEKASNDELIITLERGPIHLAYKKLFSIGEGDVLALPPERSPWLTLRIDGKRVGAAELISLGHAVGARVVALGELAVPSEEVPSDEF